MEKKKVNIILIIVLFSSVIFSSMAEASKMFDKKLLSGNVVIIDNGIKYIPISYYDSSKGRTHFVEAWDIKTDKKLWEQKIYETIYDLSFEQDVQDRMITSLSVRDNKLIVINEVGEIYEVDLKTKKVIKKSKDVPAPKFP